jgi:hypothetical protein
MVIKSIVVKSKDFNRSFNLSVSEDLIDAPQYLHNYSLNATRKTLSDFDKLFSKKIKCIEEWGDERFLVTSYFENSTIQDVIYPNEKIGDTPTLLLYNLLKEWLYFQEEYKNIENLKEIIKKAFIEICINPIQYMKWRNSTCYNIVIDNVIVSLVLIKEDGDFELTPEEYISQIKGPSGS